MKKALAIVLCLMMLVLSACGSPQDKLVGKWKLTKVSGSTTDSDMSLFVEAGELLGTEGFSMGLNLEKDGKGALTASILGQNQSYPITWTVEGNALKLTAENGDVLGLDYKLSGKTLTLEHEGMVLTFEKE